MLVHQNGTFLENVYYFKVISVLAKGRKEYVARGAAAVLLSTGQGQPRAAWVQHASYRQPEGWVALPTPGPDGGDTQVTLAGEGGRNRVSLPP